MKKINLSLILAALFISFYSCSDDDTTVTPPVEEGTEEPAVDPEDPAVTLANDRTTTITTLTKGSEKIWRIASAELTNTNGTFDISANFNVKDDEFIFRNSVLTTSKSQADFDGSLEWRKNSAVNLSADSKEAALNEFYVPAESYNIGFADDSSSELLSNEDNFEFILNANGSISGDLTLADATLKVILAEKLETDLSAVPTVPLVFSPVFTFDSNAIAGNAPDMVGSLVNNSIYIAMREDAMRDQSSGLSPERILKYDVGTTILSEKLFPQSDFVSKQLILNNNKLVVVGGQKVNTYELDIVADPMESQSYASALGLQSFFVSRNGTAVYNNFIYIIGGAMSDAALANRIYKYDIATEVITEFATMPETRSAARAEVINGKLYIFGGTKDFFGTIAENSIYIYDLNTAALTVETMPSAVNETYAGRSGDFIFVGGNIKTTNSTGDIIDEEPYMAVYDTTDGTFTELQTDLLSPAKETVRSMAVFADKIYIIYGERETLTPGQLQTWQVLAADI